MTTNYIMPCRKRPRCETPCRECFTELCAAVGLPPVVAPASAAPDNSSAGTGDAMPDERGRMTATEFREALARLDETQASFADLLVMIGGPGAVTLRTVQRWAAETQDTPSLLIVVIRLLDMLREEAGMDTDKVRELCALADDPGRELP